ncbi:hypothetical protein TNIN_99571 [Trichonephila inaurata madagascariensis]|uniref:Uncharacterized protein n=1 Tax=Trichonephila inaurata madagascariensis TaxID=2747483 RepID=A0A8X7BUS8_9ARAC|nr:hypothetical protein TNIN_99571 [Trichonephila inaurata madagascariensis]
MEIDHKHVAGRPVWCNVGYLRQKIETRSISTVPQLGAKLSVIQQTISQHLAAMDTVKKLKTWVPHALTEEQSLRPLETCTSLQEREVRAILLSYPNCV